MTWWLCHLLRLIISAHVQFKCALSTKEKEAHSGWIRLHVLVQKKQFIVYVTSEVTQVDAPFAVKAFFFWRNYLYSFLLILHSCDFVILTCSFLCFSLSMLHINEQGAAQRTHTALTFSLSESTEATISQESGRTPLVHCPVQVAHEHIVLRSIRVVFVHIWAVPKVLWAWASPFCLRYVLPFTTPLFSLSEEWKAISWFFVVIRDKYGSAWCDLNNVWNGLALCRGISSMDIRRQLTDQSYLTNDYSF